MKIISSIQEMQAYAEGARQAGKIIALVPTMGYLHQGHLSLIRLAREHANLVITSIYVNPTQFGANEDLDSYPRDLERDQVMAGEAGTDVLFVPNDQLMYPPGYQTFVTVEKLTKRLCGRSRPTHFRGVTTVVTKLFNIVKPHIAVFGQKDAQQTIVIRRMVEDLNFDIKILEGPIIRHEDGLAMSSRNRYLSPQERAEATILYQSLRLAESMIVDGERDPKKIREAMHDLIDGIASSRIDYIEIVDTRDLEPVNVIEGEILIAIAVFIGKARLIDNIRLKVG